jgi:integrase
MAGTVRKRQWTTRQGEVKTAWVVDYFDQHGERHLKTFATKRVAESWLTDTRTEVKAGVHTPDAGSITVKQAAERWLRQCEIDGLEAGFLRTYGQYARLFIVPHLGRLKLSRLTAPHVKEFRNALSAQKVRVARMRSVLSALRSVLNNAQSDGLVAQNVALAVHVKDSERDQRPVEIGVDIPTKAEMQTILQHATGRWRARLFVLTFTGLRASELRGLEWPYLDLDDRKMLGVRQRADWWGALGSPKSKNGYRDIPLAPMVLHALKEWRLAAPHRKGLPDLVFPDPDGDVLRHTSLRWGFDQTQCAAGVVTIIDGKPKPKYGLHALRHFFASWGIEQGFSPKRLQTLLGHGSIKMTYDVYGHLFPTPADDYARFAAGEASVLAAVRAVAPS